MDFKIKQMGNQDSSLRLIWYISRYSIYSIDIISIYPSIYPFTHMKSTSFLTKIYYSKVYCVNKQINRKLKVLNIYIHCTDCLVYSLNNSAQYCSKSAGKSIFILFCFLFPISLQIHSGIKCRCIG